MYDIWRGEVQAPLCMAARRRLLLELRRCGVRPDEIKEWSTNSWWPSLRDEPEFNAVRDALCLISGENETTKWAETQILIRLPDEDDTPLGPPHVDDLPPWADGMRYSSIFGVELTDTPRDGGGTVLYPPGKNASPVRPLLGVGDVLEMSPLLLHSGSPNLSPSIRMVLFFRLLEPE